MVRQLLDEVDAAYGHAAVLESPLPVIGSLGADHLLDLCHDPAVNLALLGVLGVVARFVAVVLDSQDGAYLGAQAGRKGADRYCPVPRDKAAIVDVPGLARAEGRV